MQSSNFTQQTLPYFSLPGEIRNQIMRELLVHGDIHVQPRPATRRDALATPSSSRYPDKCSSFLATCRQAREEGSAIFYGENTFQVPSGSADDMKTWMDELRPIDQNLITTMVLTFSISDIPCEQIETSCKTMARCIASLDARKCEYEGWIAPPDECVCNWLEQLGTTMNAIWDDKLRLLIEWGQVNHVDGVQAARYQSQYNEYPEQEHKEETPFHEDRDALLRFADFASDHLKYELLHIMAEKKIVDEIYGSAEHLLSDLVKAEKTYETVFVARCR